jgi:hypothetical protein
MRDLLLSHSCLIGPCQRALVPYNVAAVLDIIVSASNLLRRHGILIDIAGYIRAIGYFVRLFSSANCQLEVQTLILILEVNLHHHVAQQWNQIPA